MTKFDGVQISHRKGKQAQTYTTAELRKNMVRTPLTARA